MGALKGKETERGERDRALLRARHTRSECGGGFGGRHGCKEGAQPLHEMEWRRCREFASLVC